MRFEETFLRGLFLISRNVHEDERGIFSRFFAADEFASAGRPIEAVHINSSTSNSQGTIRGLHFQYPPFAEKKIVSCATGAVWDVGVDLRPNSPTRFKWFGTELSPKNGISMVVPEGFAHGLITLVPNSTVVYVSTKPYSPDHESGILYNDPLLQIDWPLEPKVISEKDRSWGNVEDRINELNEAFSSSKKS